MDWTTGLTFDLLYACANTSPTSVCVILQSSIIIANQLLASRLLPFTVYSVSITVRVTVDDIVPELGCLYELLKNLISIVAKLKMPVAFTFGGREYIPSHTHSAAPMTSKLIMHSYAMDYSS